MLEVVIIKELKRAVNDVEELRRNDRSFKSWYEMKI